MHCVISIINIVLMVKHLHVTTCHTSCCNLPHFRVICNTLGDLIKHIIAQMYIALSICLNMSLSPLCVIFTCNHFLELIQAVTDRLSPYPDQPIDRHIYFIFYKFSLQAECQISVEKDSTNNKNGKLGK